MLLEVVEDVDQGAKTPLLVRLKLGARWGLRSITGRGHQLLSGSWWSSYLI
jgi:hypothetical protein